MFANLECVDISITLNWGYNDIVNYEKLIYDNLMISEKLDGDCHVKYGQLIHDESL